MTEIAGMLGPFTQTPTPVTVKPVDEILHAAEAAVPDLSVRFIAFPGTPFAGSHHYMVFMRGQSPVTARLLRPLLIDAETAAVADSRSLPWYLTVLLLSQPLHFGDYGGMPLKLLWALLDVFTIVVLVSGLYLWRKKQHTTEEVMVFDSPSTVIS